MTLKVLLPINVILGALLLFLSDLENTATQTSVLECSAAQTSDFEGSAAPNE